jgi:hypothetical protein
MSKAILSAGGDRSGGGGDGMEAMVVIEVVEVAEAEMKVMVVFRVGLVVSVLPGFLMRMLAIVSGKCPLLS